MNEPAIVGYGRMHVKDYPVGELYDSLVTAFKWCHAKAVILDDCTTGQRFLAAGIAWAIDEGLLYTAQTDEGSQEVVSSFMLTDKGKKEILK